MSGSRCGSLALHLIIGLFLEVAVFLLPATVVITKDERGVGGGTAHARPPLCVRMITFGAEKIGQMNVKRPRMSRLAEAFLPVGDDWSETHGAAALPPPTHVSENHVDFHSDRISSQNKFTVPLNFGRRLQATAGGTKHAQIRPGRKSSPPASSHLPFHSVSSIFIAGF